MLSETKQTRIRLFIIGILFAVSCFSYGDRVALSLAGAAMPKGTDLSPVRMGYLFSGFSWAYVLGQLPSGGLLDRFGSRLVYGLSIIAWTTLAVLTGLAGYLGASLLFITILVLRLMSGLAQSPVFPGNGRIVSAWFPSAERGRASAVFNSSQYFALPIFAPIFGGIIAYSGWQACFWFMGLLGVVLSFIWFTNIYEPREHPRVSKAELEHIEGGGSLTVAKKNTLTWSTVKMLLSHRMLVGVYIGQYCITTLTWFFLTWFPVYLKQARHMSILQTGFAAAIPGLCGGVGGILGGIFSDRLLRNHSLSWARKMPIMAGMVLSMTMVACNYVDSQILMLMFMSISFFGKGIGALGWTVVSDTSPQGMVGMNGALFNFIGNLAGITTPIVIGYIVQRTHSFNGVLIFVSLIAFCAIVSYGPIVGKIKRLELNQSTAM